MATEQTRWPYDIPGSYHDSSCRCLHHCGNCFADLTEPQIRSRVRYCSDYCRNRARRERALDRRLSSAATAPGRIH